MCKIDKKKCDWCWEDKSTDDMTNMVSFDKKGNRISRVAGGLHESYTEYWICGECMEDNSVECSVCGNIGDTGHINEDFAIIDYEYICRECYIAACIQKDEYWRKGTIEGIEDIKNIPFGDFEGKCLDGKKKYVLYTTHWLPSMIDQPVIDHNLRQLNEDLIVLEEFDIPYFLFGDHSTHNVCSVGIQAFVKKKDADQLKKVGRWRR